MGTETSGRVVHIHMGVVRRSKGGSAAAAVAYQRGEKVRDPRTGVEYDYTFRSDDIGYKSTIGDVNGMPVQERWSGAILMERRKNSQEAYTWSLAMPNELTLDRQKALLDEFAGMYRDLVGASWVDGALHVDKVGNPHGHLIHPTRDPRGEKLRRLSQGFSHGKGLCYDTRVLWCGTANTHVARAENEARLAPGTYPRLDPRSYAVQDAHLSEDLRRIPTIHEGKSAWRLAMEGIPTAVRALNDSIQAENQRRLDERRKQVALEDLANGIQKWFDDRAMARQIAGRMHSGSDEEREKAAVQHPKFLQTHDTTRTRYDELRKQLDLLPKADQAGVLAKLGPSCEILVRELVAADAREISRGPSQEKGQVKGIGLGAF